MKLPAHLLLALALATPAAALADGETPTLAPAPVTVVDPGQSLIPELTEPTLAAPTVVVTPQTEAITELEALEIPEHDPDWCPPCGRG